MADQKKIAEMTVDELYEAAHHYQVKAISFTNANGEQGSRRGFAYAAIAANYLAAIQLRK